MTDEKIPAQVRRDLKTAQEQLLRLEPFWAYLLLRTPLVEDRLLEAAMATNGKTVAYNPFLVHERLASIPQLVFVLAHEILHVLLGHHFRRGGRDVETWNRACDYAVNGELHERFQGRRHLLDVPGWVLLEPGFAGWSAEAIYSAIQGPEPPQEVGQPSAEGNDPGGGPSHDSAPGNPHEPTGDETVAESGQGQDGAEPQTSSPSGSELPPVKIGHVLDAPEGAEQARQDLAREIAQAQLVANATGIGHHVEAHVRRVLHSTSLDFDWECQLAWMLAEACSRRGLADYSYARCRIPELVTTGLYQPVMVDLDPPAIQVAVDTSGSISERQLAEIEAGLDSIRLPYPELEVPVLYSDTRIRSRQVFGPGEPILLEPRGGGGTDFTEVFADDERPYDLLVFFTDLLVAGFPPRPARYEVLWIYTGHQEQPAVPPFGQLARLRT